MRSMKTTGNRPLEWVPFKKRRYELRCDTEVCATLAWKSFFGSLALGESGDGHWSFKRVGFFRPVVTIRETGVESDLAVFRPTRRGQAVLTFADGESFTWRLTGETKREKGFFDDRDRLLTAARPIQKFLSFPGEARVLPHATGLPRLPILAVLAWYCLCLEHEDETAAVAAVTASVG